MAEVTNPEIIRFIREQEKRIKEYLESIARPYDSMVQEAITDYNKTIESLGIFPAQELQHSTVSADLESIKNVVDLKLPPGDATMRYSAKIKTEAIVHLGFYKVLKVFKKLLKKPVQNEKEGEIQALKDGLKRMKRETERSIIDHFKNYRENIKFQYIFKLVEAASNKLYEGLVERFQSYVTDLSETVDLVNDKQSDKQQAYEILKEMELASNDVGIRINKVRGKIELIAQNPIDPKDEREHYPFVHNRIRV
jgi:predicted patatin/cPLA2 family phospholipase